jgi:hypothetical protein
MKIMQKREAPIVPGLLREGYNGNLIAIASAVNATVSARISASMTTILSIRKWLMSRTDSVTHILMINVNYNYGCQRYG